MVTINGIDCYGEMHEGQNIQVICDDEYFDEIYPDGFDTWQEAVHCLEQKYPDIIELSAV